MMPLKYIASIAILLCTIISSAQNDKLQISGELRPRILVDNGYKTPKKIGESTLIYTTQRTRLNTLFSNEKYDAYISIQDVRFWGGEDNYNSSGVYGNTESISLHQAWVKLKITEPLSLKIGSQIFSYDDQRILSARNWNDYQITYDAVLAEYEIDKHRLHVGFSYNSDNKTGLLFPSEKFKTFDFIHYQCELDKITLSSIAVITGNTLTDTTEQVFFRATYGANANYVTDKTNARLSAYYQHNINDNGGNISAYCISAYVERKLVKKLSIGLGVDYLSGNDDNSTSTTNKRFDILYGRRHGWYGYMDYFSTIPEQGLQDYMAKLTFKPTGNLDFQLHGHYFMLAADMYNNSNATEKLSRNLGQELDFIMKWKFNKMATLECGYSLYGTTNTLTKLKKVNNENLKTPQFCYIMLTVRPSLLF